MVAGAHVPDDGRVDLCVRRGITVTGEEQLHAGDVVTLHIKCLVRYGQLTEGDAKAQAPPSGYELAEDSSGEDLGSLAALTEDAAKLKKKKTEDTLERVDAFAPRFPEVRPRAPWPWQRGKAAGPDAPVWAARNRLVQAKQQKFWVYVTDVATGTFLTDPMGRPLSLLEFAGTTKVCEPGKKRKSAPWSLTRLCISWAGGAADQAWARDQGRHPLPDPSVRQAVLAASAHPHQV